MEGTYSNRLMVDVGGTAADVQRVFRVRLNHYPHPEGGTFYAPDREPSVDLQVPLQHITGLNNFARRHVKFRREPSGGGTERPIRKSGTGSGGLFQGYDFRDAYVPDVPASLNGAGQTIALVEFDGFFQSDITYYEAHANPVLSAPTPVTVLIDSFDGVNCRAVSCLDDDVEIALDIEMAISMAPGAQVVVYEASPSEDYNTAANDILAKMTTAPLPKQISSSWGGYGDSTTTNLLNILAAQGQAYFEASGDAGSMGVPGAPDLVSDDPSLYLSQYETLVGGTKLTTSTPSGSPISLTYSSESTWTDSLGASGGGICTNLTPIPTYQAPIPMTTNGGSTSWRNLPDVSMAAAKIYVVAEDLVYKGNVEGTSAASPLWAGFMALANQQAALLGKSSLGNPNPAIYRIASSPTPYFSDLHDIADGSDSRWNTIGGPASGPYTAVGGYDLATGWGSPKGQALINDLVGSTSTFTKTPTITFTPTKTYTPTRSFTPTYSFTPTFTHTPCGYPSDTCTFTLTFTPTFTPTPTFTRTLTPTWTWTNSPTVTYTPTKTLTPTYSFTPTFTFTPTNTPTFLVAPLGKLTLAPNIAGNDQPICLFLDSPVASSQWDVYDMAGEGVTQLIFGSEEACWDHKGLASGLYLIRVQGVYLDGQNFDKTFKVVILR